MTGETTQTPLPDDVQAAISRNQKIEAIKLLREAWDIGLKEAKEIVEAQWDAQKVAGTTADVRKPKTESGIGRVFWALVILAVAYSLYKHFS